MRRNALALSFLGVVLGAISQAASPPPLGIADAYGVNVHAGSLSPGDFTLIRSAGFTWIRTDLFWQSVEHERGRFDFTAFDRLADELQSQNLRALVILDYGNSLYAEAGDTSPFVSRVAQDDFRRAYAAFASAAVERYSGKGLHLGIME